MRELRYREALREAMLEEMERDERVFLMGEEVGHYQGAYKVSEGLLDKFGERRVIDTPIAESGFAGIGIGAAMVGLRPIIEFMTWNFSFVAFDQVISNAAKIHQMSAGAIHVPIVFRGPNGAARQVASQHSHAVAPFYVGIPGLYVCQPSTPRDAKGLLKTAIRSNNPVIFLEGETLYGVKGEVPDEGVEELIPFGASRVARHGADCTIVTWGRPYYVAMAAAEKLAADGTECEVIDPRTLRPLDMGPVIKSVRKTNRCVVVHEHWPYGGPGAEVVDRVQREAFDYLDAPVERVTGLDVPMPYALNLENEVLPTEERVIDAVKRVSYAK
ncbi:MAG: pyruvate dehydrogenase complex E1 component subunit beta [Myxococcales bacterium]|nr:pyruvate dehydrogenase complex E1 component subunit beta [Myxococcales bacterium]MDH3485992.1 pyruvate dehydrogenase complex E1 component subunit beta [Myxococcales bacterium]